jgi:hypothetical protein
MMIRRGASSEGTLDFELDLLDAPETIETAIRAITNIQNAAPASM